MSSTGIPTTSRRSSTKKIATTWREPETHGRLAKVGLAMVHSSQSGLTDVLQRAVGAACKRPTVT